MKKLMLLSVFTLSGIFSYAAKYTVDNTPNSAANYSTIPAAIAAASNGDTLLVYGSPYSYGSVTVNKTLTIIGSAGFDPEVTNEDAPVVDVFTLSTGSDSSLISGFHVGYIGTNGGTVNRIGIYNNYFTSTSTGIQWYNSTSTDWVIEGNIFQAYNQNRFIQNYNNNSLLSNILIKNNYFEILYVRYYIGEYNNSAFTYRNNVFVLRNNNGTPFCYSCNSVLFENNIFWVTVASNTDFTDQSCTDCVFNNNIIYNSGGGTMTDIGSIGNGVTGNNNFMNQDPQFVSFTQGDNYTVAEDYRLLGTSPGKSAGTDGTDIGLYGGNYNWENRKYPKAFPHQEIFNVINSSVPQGTPLNVNIKPRKATN